VDKIYQSSGPSQMVKSVIGPKQKRFGGSRLSISSLTDVLFFIGNMSFSIDYSAVASKTSLQFCYQPLQVFRVRPTNVYVKSFSKDSMSPVSASSNDP
jgi:hypothetical protein